MTDLQTDVLVVGGGLAGQNAAYAAAQKGCSVTIVSKNECASSHIIGFSAPVGEADSLMSFTKDIMKAGYNLNIPELVEAFVQRALSVPEWLEKLGIKPDKQNGKLELMCSLGHSHPRLVHRGTVSGSECMGLLSRRLAAMGVRYLKGYSCAALIKASDCVCGAIFVQAGGLDIFRVSARSVILATGGCHITQRSTYPVSSSGDGYALAYQAGAALMDMEFIQHEPLRCATRPIGLSTTMLPQGGTLRNRRGERFILDRYENESIPTKDELSQLIVLEIAKGEGTKNGGIYADMTSLRDTAIAQHQQIYDRFHNRGIDLRSEMVEVAPAAHTMMGGIRIKRTCGTEVKGLFAAGEVTGGLHGASRLGGNAGTETLVMGQIAGENAADFARHEESSGKAVADDFEKWAQSLVRRPDGGLDLPALREHAYLAMAQGMGPVREKHGIENALDRLETLSKSLDQTGISSPGLLEEYLEMGNLLLTCRLACLGALNRKESRGAHYRTDYPSCDDSPLHICFQKDRGMTFCRE